MHVLALAVGLLLIAATLVDGFETILLPRRVNHRFRYARLYFLAAWSVWRRAAGLVSARRGWREGALAAFGPLSMFGLFGTWVASLILGFALLHWSLASPIVGADGAQAPRPSHFPTDLYFSGTTFVTLGLGDVSPRGRLPRALTVAEAGMGFGFLAVIITYLPVLYQAFSRREVTISLFDARAGSPPTAGELLVRAARAGRLGAAGIPLGEWERWCAELLESHLSFPVIAYYRSQHANQSWLAALAVMLDTCAVLLSSVPAGGLAYPAQLAFAMARHAAVDVALIFAVRPHAPREERLPPAARAALHARLREAGVRTDDSAEADRRLGELRGAYEPFLAALADHFALALPPLAAEGAAPADNWQRSAWMPRPPGIGSLPAAPTEGDHFG
jgi:hypothetical protein